MIADRQRHRPLPAALARAGALLLLALGLVCPTLPSQGQGWSEQAGKAVDLFGGVLGGSRSGTAETGGGDASLPLERVGAGLKEALSLATERAVATVGKPNGYFNDPEIHIPLPESLQRAQALLGRVGMGHLGETLEQRLNRAAETAAPEAQAVFLDAIGQMTLGDAERILNGPSDAATQYLQRSMSAPLKQRLRPIVEQAVAETGVVQAYERMLGGYRDAVPFLPDMRADLTGYTLDQGLAGLFHTVAEEEARIREDPAARTTDLLRQVFSGR